MADLNETPDPAAAEPQGRPRALQTALRTGRHAKRSDGIEHLSRLRRGILVVQQLHTLLKQFGWAQDNDGWTWGLAVALGLGLTVLACWVPRLLARLKRKAQRPRARKLRR